ncbi:uncharacterized protein BP5553_08366 [Venustampulla echinocandica]|uniref:Uncharacterized protein n=1 Tax=Venustampulla echinocandica TaxID=2656787 RepID=A0A370TGH7_9HELO|nr:uncharacterized protein BP5553_08366 [Venustampulla echinocandica]RDL33998.1 hypothetical protein BP5553_08366 [Venustampulla echinocandica]
MPQTTEPGDAPLKTTLERVPAPIRESSTGSEVIHGVVPPSGAKPSALLRFPPAEESDDLDEEDTRRSELKRWEGFLDKSGHSMLEGVTKRFTKHKPSHPKHQEEVVTLSKTKYGVPDTKDQLANNSSLDNGLDHEGRSGKQSWKKTVPTKEPRLATLDKVAGSNLEASSLTSAEKAGPRKGRRQNSIKMGLPVKRTPGVDKLSEYKKWLETVPNNINQMEYGEGEEVTIETATAMTITRYPRSALKIIEIKKRPVPKSADIQPTQTELKNEQGAARGNISTEFDALKPIPGGIPGSKPELPEKDQKHEGLPKSTVVLDNPYKDEDKLGPHLREESKEPGDRNIGQGQSAKGLSGKHRNFTARSLQQGVTQTLDPRFVAGGFDADDLDDFGELSDATSSDLCDTDENAELL